jgi:hypothetical protein
VSHAYGDASMSSAESSACSSARCCSTVAAQARAAAGGEVHTFLDKLLLHCVPSASDTMLLLVSTDGCGLNGCSTAQLPCLDPLLMLVLSPGTYCPVGPHPYLASCIPLSARAPNPALHRLGSRRTAVLRHGCAHAAASVSSCGARRSRMARHVSSSAG